MNSLKSLAHGAVMLAVLLAGLATANGAASNSPAQPPQGSGNRYLLIFDTSRGMARRADSLVNSVGELVLSGMNGQMRQGDTLGIWTFDESLHTGMFPLQTWGSGKTHAEMVTKNVLKFVRGLTYDSKANFAGVTPLLNELIKNSHTLTIIVFSDGFTEISGTPFDRQINRSYASWSEEQQRQRKPIITALLAQDGKLTDHVVAAVPWPLKLPAPSVSRATAQKTGHSSSNPPPVGKPLIVTGKKPAKTGEPNTNAPLTVVISNSNALSASQPEPKAGTAASPPAIPGAEPLATVAPPPVVTPEAAPKPAVPLGTAGVVIAQPDPAAAPLQRPTSTNPMVGQAIAPKPEAPIPLRPPQGKTEAGPVAELATPKPKEGPISARPTEAVATASPLGTITPAPGPPSSGELGSTRSIAIASTALVLGVVGLVALLVARRRSRQNEPVSLITRSLDKKRDL